MNLSNSHIVSNLKAEDEKYFEKFYKHFFPRLCAFASQYVSREDAEGVVQETMIWLWKNRQTLIEDMSVVSLLFTITKNKALNIAKQKKMQSIIKEKLIKKFESEFENPDLYTENELFTICNEAINALPDHLKEVFILSRLHNMTHAEIATKLEVSPQTINYRMGQSLAILREKLKDYLPLLAFLLNC